MLRQAQHDDYAKTFYKIKPLIMNYVTEAKYLKDYQIRITFSDGKKTIVNLENTIKADRRKIFQELIDKKNFQNFKVAMDTIVWKNGLDLAPEFLYNL